MRNKPTSTAKEYFIVRKVIKIYNLQNQKYE